MAKVLVNEKHLTDIAEAIREKSGDSRTYTPDEMATAIENIPGSVEVTNGTLKMCKAKYDIVKANTFVKVSEEIGIRVEETLDDRDDIAELVTIPLSDNKYFLVYRVTNVNKIYAAICTVGNGIITKGEVYEISTLDNAREINSEKRLTAWKDADNVVLVAFVDGTIQTGANNLKIYGVMCTISSDVITYSNKFFITEDGGYKITLTKNNNILSGETKSYYFLTYYYIEYKKNNNNWVTTEHPSCIVFTFTNNEIDILGNYPLTDFSLTAHDFTSVALSGESVLVIGNRYSSTLSGTVYYLRNGDLYTPGTSGSTINISFISNTSDYSVATILPDNNRIVIIYKNNRDSIYGATLFNNPGSHRVIAEVLDVSLSSGQNVGFLSVKAMENNRAFISYNMSSNSVYGQIYTFDNISFDTIGDRVMTEFELPISSYMFGNYYSSGILSDGNIIITHNDLGIKSSVLEKGEVVEQARENPDGLTKTDCTFLVAGEVYILPKTV